MDENTRLVALASCHFISGYRVDFQAIGKYLRERNILFCLDAIQTLGAFPTTVEHVDLLAADAHKWLLGPCGAGVMYVRGSAQERINPPIYGWNNVRCPNYVAQEQIVLRTGSQKYEAGTHNLLGIVGLVAAMELIAGAGRGEHRAGAVAETRAGWCRRCRRRAARCCRRMRRRRPAAASSRFTRPGSDLAALHQKLTDAGIVTSLRADRTGQKYIRLSPHFYNTDAELERVVELVT